jgi:hypothetical protein
MIETPLEASHHKKDKKDEVTEGITSADADVQMTEPVVEVPVAVDNTVKEVSTAPSEVQSLPDALQDKEKDAMEVDTDHTDSALVEAAL